MSSIRPLAFAAATILVAACQAGNAADRHTAAVADSVRADSIARARQDSVNRAQPGYVIDSVVPVEEELRRFRAAIGAPQTAMTALAGGRASREELVRAFVRAVAASDSGSLRAMQLDVREFADLVYPSSPYTHPPYQQAPGLVWAQIERPSHAGYGRLMRRMAGAPLAYVDHRCPDAPDIQGPNTIWTGCTLRVVRDGRDTVTARLFGSIIERRGRFKFVSYTNQF
jgi:hypothetical protein